MAAIIKPILPRPTTDAVKVARVVIPPSQSAGSYETVRMLNEINEAGTKIIEALGTKLTAIEAELEELKEEFIESIPQTYQQLVDDVAALSATVAEITSAHYFTEADLMSESEMNAMLDRVFGPQT